MRGCFQGADAVWPPQGREWMARELFGGNKGLGFVIGTLRAGRAKQLKYQVQLSAHAPVSLYTGSFCTRCMCEVGMQARWPLVHYGSYTSSELTTRLCSRSASCV